MEKYILVARKYLNKKDISLGGAANKAPDDVNKVYMDNGYKPLYININNTSHTFKKNISILYQLVKLKSKINKDSILVFQYPEFSPIIYTVISIIFNKTQNVVIIHDINSIRLKGSLNYIEKLGLSSFNHIIVHSKEMEEKLREKINKPIFYILDYFPYIAIPETKIRHYSLDVCFAGNIYKSTSIIDYFNYIHDLRLMLYIKLRPTLVLNNKTIHKGLFNPNNIQGIEGSWGLIWDGNSLNECSGYDGEYTKINAPHKFSLYVIAKLPIIVWSKSAIAKIVQEKEIGITIDSLIELEEKLVSITPERYNLLYSNISNFSTEIVNGGNLKKIIKEIESNILK